MLGIWAIDIIDEISKKYDVKISGELILVKANGKEFSEDFLKKGLEFRSDAINHIELLTSDIYYSGVMPRVMSVDYVENPINSKQIKYLIFNVARTIFATLDFMDNPRIVSHSFFTEDGLDIRYNKMIRFDNYDDMMQAKYLYSSKSELKCDNQRLYEKNEIDRLNKYLKYSFNKYYCCFIKYRDKRSVFGYWKTWRA